VGSHQRVVYNKSSEATLAQLVERLIRNQQVAGSIPAGGSIPGRPPTSRPMTGRRNWRISSSARAGRPSQTPSAQHQCTAAAAANELLGLFAFSSTPSQSSINVAGTRVTG
jgi:hypothetical protein